MARSLSWIETTEFSSLFAGSGAEEASDIDLAGFIEDPPGFDLRRRSSPAQQAQRSASQPAPSPRMPAAERHLAKAAQAVGVPAATGEDADDGFAAAIDALAADAPAPPPARRAAPAPASGVIGRSTPTLHRTHGTTQEAPLAPSEEPTHVYRTPKLAASAPSMAAFAPSAEADVLGRMGEYIDWLTKQSPLEAVAIADAQGLVVAERNAAEADAVIATSIEVFLEHANAVLERKAQEKEDTALFGYVALKHGDRHVAAVWAPSAYGRFYGIFIGRVTPTPDMLTLAGQGFRAIFAE